MCLFPLTLLAGNLDVMRGIKENDTIALEAYNYPSHLDFLELNVTTGNASLAVIQTRKPLDAEALKDVSMSSSSS